MKKKLLTTLAIVSVVLIAGCNCNEKGGLWNNGRDYENPDGGSGSGYGGSGSGTPGQLAPGAVDLKTAGNYVILAKSGISTTGTTLITGNIGVSPIAHIGLTGFSETMDASNVFSTSVYVVGNLYASDYAVPTPATLTTAVLDMEAAYTDAAGRATSLPLADYLNLGAGTIGASTAALAPGVYTWASALDITGDITLNGGQNAVFIFQVNGTLDMEPAAKIILSGGAQAKNIFWQVTGAVTLFPGSHFEGTILAKEYIAMQDGASINGRLLAQTAVTLIGSTVKFSGTSGGGTNPGGNGNGCGDYGNHNGTNPGGNGNGCGDYGNHNGTNPGGNGNGCGDYGNHNGKDKKDDRGGNKHFGQN